MKIALHLDHNSSYLYTFPSFTEMLRKLAADWGSEQADCGEWANSPMNLYEKKKIVIIIPYFSINMSPNYEFLNLQPSKKQPTCLWQTGVTVIVLS